MLVCVFPVLLAVPQIYSAHLVLTVFLFEAVVRPISTHLTFKLQRLSKKEPLLVALQSYWRRTRDSEDRDSCNCHRPSCHHPPSFHRHTHSVTCTDFCFSISFATRCCRHCLRPHFVPSSFDHHLPGISDGRTVGHHLAHHTTVVPLILSQRSQLSSFKP